ncbi:MAG: hypothetical protein ACRDL2_15100 [Gaiellaceae bacterium]
MLIGGGYWLVERIEEARERFLESFAERDYSEAESLPDHQLEHPLEQERDIRTRPPRRWYAPSWRDLRSS